MQVSGIPAALFAAVSFISVSPVMAWYYPEPCDPGTRRVFVRQDHGTSEIFCSATYDHDPDGEPRRIPRICHVSGEARMRLINNEPIEECVIRKPEDCRLYCE
jgi:hypothetical protein